MGFLSLLSSRFSNAILTAQRGQPHPAMKQELKQTIRKEIVPQSADVLLRYIRTVVVVEVWQAYVTPDGGMHIIGRNENEKTPRISSELIRFDSATLYGWTQDRRYQLWGPPGICAEAQLIWPNYCGYHQLHPDLCRDISPSLWSEHQRLNAAHNLDS